MGYVDSHLMRGEKVVYRAHLHAGAAYAGTVIIGLIVGPLGVMALIGGAVTAGLLALGIVILLWLAARIRMKKSEFVVTDQRVIIKVGWLNQRSVETLLSKVESIGVEQDLGGRLFGYGSIVVTGTGGTHERFKLIADPLEFRKQVQQQTATTQGTRVPNEALPTGRDERECPYCAERILAKAKVCKHCGREVAPLTQ